MLSKEDLNNYIANIPAIPSVLKNCTKAINDGDMVKAANLAAQDKALIIHFQNIVNKPIFGFREELHDAKQIFGVLGIERVKQILKSYYTLLITPKDWEVFRLNSHIFGELQASLLIKWEKILHAKNSYNEELASVATLIPAAVSVCENIFKDHKDMVLLIKEQKAISYEEILKKTSGYNFFDIVTAIGKKWEFSEEIIQLLNFLSNPKTLGNDIKSNMMKYLSLLINYEFSRPIFIESGINDLFEINTDFPEDMIVEFYELMVKIDT